MSEWFRNLFKGVKAPASAEGSGVAMPASEISSGVAMPASAISSGVAMPASVEVKTAGGLDKVVVGEVMSKDKHPNADRLSVTRVKIAEDSVLDIVCGAPNVEAGQKVAVALVGASLPNGMKIESREVRGVRSNGMICAEDELGLGTDHAGIMVLDAGLVVGTPIREALGK